MISIGTGIWRGPPGVNVAGGVTARADVPIVSLDVAGFWPGVTELGLNAQVGMYCACTCTSVVTAHVRATALAKPFAPATEIVDAADPPAVTVLELGVVDRLKSGGGGVTLMATAGEVEAT